MWILFGILSLVCTGLNVLWTAAGSSRAGWAAAGGWLCLIGLLLDEYRQAAGWAAAGDWSALADVLPSMLFPLTAGTAAIAAVNLLLFIWNSRRH